MDSWYAVLDLDVVGMPIGGPRLVKGTLCMSNLISMFELPPALIPALLLLAWCPTFLYDCMETKKIVSRDF